MSGLQGMWGWQDWRDWEWSGWVVGWRRNYPHSFRGWVITIIEWCRCKVFLLFPFGMSKWCMRVGLLMLRHCWYSLFHEAWYLARHNASTSMTDFSSGGWVRVKGRCWVNASCNQDYSFELEKLNDMDNYIGYITLMVPLRNLKQDPYTVGQVGSQPLC